MPTGVTRAQFTIDFEPTIVRWNVTALLPEVKPVLQWQVTNSTRSPIPPADDMIVHMNIWLFRGQTTNLTLPAVPVVFESFTFTPSSQGGL